MRRLAIAALAAVSTLAAAQLDPKTLQLPPSARWFSLDRTDNGVVAGGNLEGTAWAFHVRGSDLKRHGADTTFSLDGAVIQVRAVPRTLLPFGVRNVLEAHKRFEQDYQQRQSKGKIQFGDHAFCNSKVAHEHWTARPEAKESNITQVYVTFEVGDYVLMVVLPYENEARERAVARAIGDICSTFQRQKI